MKYYDYRLGIYQSISALPFQIALLDLFDRLDKTQDSSYVATALLNAGSNLSAYFIARSVYDLLHDSNKKQNNVDYVVSPFTAYMYDHNVKAEESIDPEHRESFRLQNEKMLSHASAFDSRNIKSEALFYAVTSTYGFLSSLSKGSSLTKSLLYGLTQPTSIILSQHSPLATKK